MKVLNSSKRGALLKEIVRPLRFMDENKGIEPLFRSMLRNKDHLVMVLRKNRKNEVVGIITLEDILEELVGEIIDETDEQKSRAKY
jgi:CBS domain containing-hemolysin-like protein